MEWPLRAHCPITLGRRRSAPASSTAAQGTGSWGLGRVGERRTRWQLYFAAGPGSSDGGGRVDTELWTSDGTTAGTIEGVDVNPTGSSDPRDLVRLGDAIIFSATNGQYGRELWRLDP